MEEYEIFEMHQFNYMNCKDRINAIMEWIKTRKEELEQTEKELGETKLALEKEEAKREGR